MTNGDGMCDTRRIIPVRRAEIEFLAAAPHAAVRLSLPPATRFESINMFIRELDITQRYGFGSVTLFMPVGTHPADAKIVWFFFLFFCLSGAVGPDVGYQRLITHAHGSAASPENVGAIQLSSVRLLFPPKRIGFINFVGNKREEGGEKKRRKCRRLLFFFFFHPPVLFNPSSLVCVRSSYRFFRGKRRR